MKPDQQQQTVIDSQTTQTAVIAGAGSGKTSTMVTKIVKDIKDGRPRHDMGVFTFTVAAAREFRERIEDRLGYDPRLGWCGTLHGYCMKQLTRANLVEKIITEREYNELLKTAATRLNISDSQLQEIRSRLAKRQRPGVKGDLLVNTVDREMRAEKTTAIDRLIPTTIKMMKSGKLHGSPAHTYIDEYQDTSQEDAELYTLMNPETQFVVGDPDQAIMAFRGGDHKQLQLRAEQAKTQDGLFFLETNYRCASSICEFADTIIKKSNIRPLEKSSHPRATAPEGTIRFRRYATNEMEFSEIAKYIAKCIEAGAKPQDFAILARYNNEAHRMASALRDGHNLPVVVAGQRDRSESKAIDEAVATLKDVGGNFWPPSLQAAISKDRTTINLHTALRLLGVSQKAAEVIATTASENPDNWYGTVEDHGNLIEAVAERQEAVNGTANSIVVSTVHKAKGKEWKNVFVIGTDVKGWPKNDEHLKLAYVAVTRAEVNLYITSAAEKTVDLPGGRTMVLQTTSSTIFDRAE